MSSLKMTFSLTSLILILGLVFATVPAMAHPVTEDNNTGSQIHAGDTVGMKHLHPEAVISAADADPTRDGIQVVDEDTTAEGLQFELVITYTGVDADNNPLNAPADVTVRSHDGKDAVGTVAGTGSGNPAAINFMADPNNRLRFTETISVTGFPDIRTAEQLAASPPPAQDPAADMAAAINAGLMILVEVPASRVTSDDTFGDYAGQDNLEKDITLTVIPNTITPAVPAMGEASPSKVNGSTNVVVTISATDSEATLPTLTDDDFSVTEATAAGTALAPTVAPYDSTNNTLTITPDATAEDDSTITVSASTAGMLKITLAADVTVEVDRTPPMVMITPPTDDVVAGRATTATITISGGDTDEAVELDEITVTQNANGALTVLSHSYKSGTGEVTFTPTAASRVTVSVDAGAVEDDVENESEAESVTFDVVSPTAVMATALPSKVNGSTNVVVTISAAAPATVPSGLAASDFSVTEATAAGTALSPTVVGYANNMLTITPDATAEDDSTITVNASTVGMLKITLAADVTVEVDRTLPVVTITPPTGDVKAKQDTTATITISGGDTGEAVAAGEITVTQTVTGSDPTVLGHTYDAATGEVTFTPTAASKVKVSVDAGAVMDGVGNESEARSIEIDVAPADTVDTTPPTITITGTRTGRTLAVTITAADTDSGLGSGEEIDGSEIEVENGTKPATITAGTTVTFDVTINYEVTEVTVTVAAEAVSDAAATPNASIEKTETFTITPPIPAPVGGAPTDAENILSGLIIPAETHLVIARSDVIGLPSSVEPVTWNGMPDLEALLFSGGTINVTRAKTPKVDHDNDDPEGDGKKADGTTDASATRDIGTRDVVITEVMAAINTATPGDLEAKIAHQWIEVYNKLKVPVTGITLSTKAGHPAGFPAGAPTGENEVLLDRLSNVVGVGWKFEGLGANGFADIDEDTANADFVSFYRNHRGEPGWQKNRWTTSTDVYLVGHKGSPGTKEREAVSILATDTLNQKPAIINEVGNFPTDDKDYEWVEILVTDGTHRFKNWEVEIVTAAKTIKSVFTLPEIPDAQKIGKDGILLVTSTDPAKDPDHPLAAGYNVMENDANQARGVSSNHPVRYIVRKFENELPKEEFVLVLRTNKDKNLHETVVDVAGYHSNLKVDEAGLFTNLWPLRNFGAPASPKNQLSEGEVHYRQHTGVVGTGTTHGDKKDDQVAMRGAPWTGIGYKRNADAATDADRKQHGGTPGYPYTGTDLTQGGALVRQGDTAKQSVIISEIMYSAGRNLPQWIELQNMSNTVGINLDNWSLFVVNHNLTVDGEEYEDGKLSERIDLDGKIPPGQTFLIASTSNRHTTNLPNERVWDLRRGVGEKLLNSNGFYLTLKAETHESDAKKHQTIDTAGNLADPTTVASRREDAQSFADLAWELPSGVTEDGARVSIARKTSEKILNKDGTKEWSWISSDMDARINRIKDRTHYGHSTDISSPGMTVGSALPVSLSKFRPERLKDTGEIVVRWITESELNNAGFNILRSEKRDGAFTKVHFVAGQGTTSERTVYEWKDKSAKPNVVYYYQIQDISLDGEVTTLQTTHLRGNVSAAGKATTTWGKIKALQ